MHLQSTITKHNLFVKACKKIDELNAAILGGDYSKQKERDKWTVIKAHNRPTVREYLCLEENGIID